jgi:hypothetical protein
MNNTVKLNSGQFYAKINPYILNAIDSEGYELKEPLLSDKDKLQFVADCYNSEFNHPYNKQRYPNNQQRFAEWLQGLPSCFNIDFMNYRIIELAKEWQTIPQDASEKIQDKVIANWFNMVANKTIRLMGKNNVTI